MIDLDQFDENAEATENTAEDEFPLPRYKRYFVGWRKAALALAVVLIVGLAAYDAGYVSNPLQTGRDAGGFAGGSDYGDWGGSDWDYDYSWDWDDGDDWSWDWGAGNNYGYSTGSSDSDAFDVVIVFIIIGIIAAVYMMPAHSKKSKAESAPGNAKPAGAARTPESKLKPLDELQERDPNFSAADIEETVSNLYVQMQEAWTAGDFEPMRPYFTKQLFGQFSNQLKALTAKGHTNHVDNIAVLEAAVRGWYEVNDDEVLVMRLRTRIIDYTVDKQGNLVSGRTDTELFMEYEYKLMRPIGTTTADFAGQTEAGECPNCGAAINIAQSTQCPYCGSVIESRRFPWVITAIKGIAQHTGN